jgi:anti-sigma factor RsiW
MTADKPIQSHDDLACIEAVEIMTDYLEGALPADDARRLEHHVDTCPGCIEYLEQLGAVAGSLGALTDDSLPGAMRERLLATFRDFRAG